MTCQFCNDYLTVVPDEPCIYCKENTAIGPARSPVNSRAYDLELYLDLLPPEEQAIKAEHLRALVNAKRYGPDSTQY